METRSVRVVDKSDAMEACGPGQRLARPVITSADWCRWAGPPQREPGTSDTEPGAGNLGTGNGAGSAVAEAGIVVGVIAEQEDLLGWWLGNYRRLPGRPAVAFADFGMSEAGWQRCAEHGPVLDLAGAPAEGWFRKPFAILRAPFRRIMWCDLDCELRRDVRPVFSHARGGAIGLPVERYASPQARGLPEDVKLYEPGVVVVNHGDETILEWAALCMNRPWDVPGDQELLSLLLHCRPRKVKEIPPEQYLVWQARRQAERAAIRHWCGERGKQKLRRRIASGRPVRSQRAVELPHRLPAPRRILFSPTTTSE